MLRVYAVYVTLLSPPSRYAQLCGLSCLTRFVFSFFQGLPCTIDPPRQGGARGKMFS